MRWRDQDGNLDKLDTDATDEAAWQARKTFAAASQVKRAKSAREISAKVQADKRGVTAASHTKLDTDHTDEVAWQHRKDLAAASKARRAARAKELKEANAKIFSSIKATKRSDEIDDDLTGASCMSQPPAWIAVDEPSLPSM